MTQRSLRFTLNKATGGPEPSIGTQERKRRCDGKMVLNPSKRPYASYAVVEDAAEHGSHGFVVGVTTLSDGRRMPAIVPATVHCTYTFCYKEDAPLREARGFHSTERAHDYFLAQQKISEQTQPSEIRKTRAKHARPSTEVHRREQQRQKRRRLIAATEQKKSAALDNPDECDCTKPCKCFDRWHKALKREFTITEAEFEKTGHRVQGEVMWKAFRRKHDGFTVGPFGVKVTWKRVDGMTHVKWDPK